MRVRSFAALLPLAFVLLSAGPAAADTAPPTFPILPNQYFDGVVNGKTAAAIVYTVCPGPSTGRNGHPAQNARSEEVIAWDFGSQNGSNTEFARGSPSMEGSADEAPSMAISAPVM